MIIDNVNDTRKRSPAMAQTPYRGPYLGARGGLRARPCRRRGSGAGGRFGSVNSNYGPDTPLSLVPGLCGLACLAGRAPREGGVVQRRPPPSKHIHAPERRCRYWIQFM